MTTLANAVIGEYRLLESLGAGGMGEVYRAVHSRIGRVVAIKILSRVEPGLRLAERFVNEARIQAGLHHPHIAELYDFVEFEGRPCIIMEYVDGISLHDRIQQTRAGLPGDEALAVFRSVVEAIAYLHERGILHRDIKSSNIKLGSSGQVKLLDFGIARDPSSRQLTMVGGCVGTMDYLAPEQIRGKSADARADVWSLGVLFYEMLTANMPFAADSVGVLCDRITRAEYRTPTLSSPLSGDLMRIVGRCLRRDAAERYADARALLDDLPTPGRSPPARTPVESRLRSDSRSALPENWPLLGAGLLLAGVVLAGFFWKLRPDPATDSPPKANAEQALPAEPQGASLRLVRIGTIDGPADIYEDGKLLGTTAIVFEKRYPVGAHVALILKREGHEDEHVEFEVRQIGNEFLAWQLRPTGRQ
jgi:serine/threonine protein kinase